MTYTAGRANDPLKTLQWNRGGCPHRTVALICVSTDRDLYHDLDHLVDHLYPDLPLRYVAQGLYSADPTQKACATSESGDLICVIYLIYLIYQIYLPRCVKGYVYPLVIAKKPKMFVYTPPRCKLPNADVGSNRTINNYQKFNSL